MKLLLSGPPRSGKSTLLRRLAESYGGNVGGFLTREMRGPDHIRCGFMLQVVSVSPGGRLQVHQQSVLAHTALLSPLRVGRYGVNPDVLALGVQALDAAMHEGMLVLIDEIGPIQVLSEDFRDAVRRCLQSDCPFIGTLSQAPDPFLDAIRIFPGARTVEVSRQNRQHLVSALVPWIRG